MHFFFIEFQTRSSHGDAFRK